MKILEYGEVIIRSDALVTTTKDAFEVNQFNVDGEGAVHIEVQLIEAALLWARERIDQALEGLKAYKPPELPRALTPKVFLHSDGHIVDLLSGENIKLDLKDQN